MRQTIKKILFSKHIYPLFRRAFYLWFKFNGGNGGRDAQAYLRQLNTTEYSSLSELVAIQNHKLKKLIEEVYENVPYYRKVMNQRLLKPSDIKTVDDLKKLPILTKQIIRENLNSLINQRYDKNRLKRGFMHVS